MENQGKSTKIHYPLHWGTEKRESGPTRENLKWIGQQMMKLSGAQRKQHHQRARHQQQVGVCIDGPLEQR